MSIWSGQEIQPHLSLRKGISSAHISFRIFTMELSLALRFIHVLSALVWFGGGLSLALLGTFYERRGDLRTGVAVVTVIAVLGPAVFLPASVLTLMSGAMLFVIDGLPWTAWTILSLPLVAAAFGLGAGVVRPTGERIALLQEAGHEGIAIDMTRRVLRVARLETALLIAIIVLMVARPDWGDHDILAPTGAFVILAALTFFMRRRPLTI
jgi:uncharacterized membrane protein